LLGAVAALFQEISDTDEGRAPIRAEDEACGSAPMLFEMEEQMRVKLGVTILAISIPLIVTGWAAERAGGCGEYMYWKDGKCVDARNHAPEAWPDQMAKKKATW